MSANKILVQAVEAHQAGRLEDAEKLYQKTLALRPREATALQNLGLLLYGRGELDQAAKLIRRSLTIDAKRPEAYNNLGTILRTQGQLDEAIAAFRQAIRLQPNESAYNNLGNALRAKGDLAGAVDCYEQAIRIRPDYFQSYYHLGITCRIAGRLDEAVAWQEKALEYSPRFAQALAHLGISLTDLGRLPEAVGRYRQALEIAPAFFEAWSNLGNTLKRMGDIAGAEAAYREALRLKPDFISARLNLGTLLGESARHEEAIACFREVVAVAPMQAAAWGKLSFERRYICDWQDFAAIEEKVRGFVRAGPTDITCFSLITLDTTPDEQLLSARHFAAPIAAAAVSLPQRPAQRRDKIRIGYLSADYHPHATAYLMAELFERHDRSRFEIAGYSLGADSDTDIRRRLVAGFDRFVDLRPLAHGAAAQRIHDDGIDILVDLKGYTQNARSEILACRPAPVQVNYLGYPGTMGAPFIDYVIADRFIIPPAHHGQFDEKVVALPHSYQPNDTRRGTAPLPTRAACGLPEQGFVFCSFNNPYKFTPQVFDIWMRLLAQVPGSVLWLLHSTPLASDNLRREAQARGIDPARLVFAPALPLPAHLARQGLADLFLDTFPVNAHTTASDALWGGLPLVTCAGRTFISRVAGSLLTTVGLPELIAGDLPAYEALALDLARDPARLAAIRLRLADSRQTSPLFDIARFTRNLEAAYAQMWQRHLDGQPPAAFDVADQGGA